MATILRVQLTLSSIHKCSAALVGLGRSHVMVIKAAAPQWGAVKCIPSPMKVVVVVVVVVVAVVDPV